MTTTLAALHGIPDPLFTRYIVNDCFFSSALDAERAMQLTTEAAAEHEARLRAYCVRRGVLPGAGAAAAGAGRVTQSEAA